MCTQCLKVHQFLQRRIGGRQDRKHQEGHHLLCHRGGQPEQGDAGEEGLLYILRAGQSHPPKHAIIPAFWGVRKQALYIGILGAQAPFFECASSSVNSS